MIWRRTILCTLPLILLFCLQALASPPSPIGPGPPASNGPRNPPVLPEPRIPAGADPGGIAIALLGYGADYTQPDIAARLARDGEGVPIAWDFADNDNRPFAKLGRGTADARTLISAAAKNPGGEVRIILVKQATADPVALGRMVAFSARTPARIIVWPDANPKRPDWPILTVAAKRFPHILFVIPRVDSIPRGTALPELINLVVLSSTNLGSTNSTTTAAGGVGMGTQRQAALLAALLAAAKAGALLAASPNLGFGELKRKLLARTQ